MTQTTPAHGALTDAVFTPAKAQTPSLRRKTLSTDAKKAEADRADAERYRYLRNRNPDDVLTQTGKAAGCWIDCENEDGTLVLLTGDDADEAINAARQQEKQQ